MSFFKWLYGAMIFLFPYAICLVFALSLASYFDWAEQLFYICFISFALSAFFAMSFFSDARVPSGVSQSRKYVALQLDQLKKQMLLAAVFTAATGGLSIFLTAQTIYEADQAQTQFVENRAILNSLEDTQRSRDDLQKSIPVDLSDQTALVLQEQLRALNSEIRQLNLQVSGESARTVTNPDGSISSEFLFQFFSNLFVRLGTIAIVVIMFGICFAQFRRLSTRYQEVYQLGLIVVMTEEGLDIDRAKAARAAFHIADEPSKVEKGSLETVFADQMNDTMSGWFDKFSEVFRSDQKPGQT